MPKKLHCLWAPEDDPIYREYHDTEWGVPEYDDRALFEKLILDGFQAGLSWRTILYKRNNFRKAFDDFEPQKIVRYTPKKVERLLSNEGIIRSKVEDRCDNRQCESLISTSWRSGSFSDFLWDFVDGKPIVNKLKNYRDGPTKSAESEAMSKELKRRGFKFCGPVIVYAFMQAVGMVNDHETTCPRWKAVQKLAR